MTQRPSDPGIQRPGDPVDPVTLFCIMNSECRLMMQTNNAMGKRFASFYRCLAFARFWEVKFWGLFITCQYFNDGWTDFHKNIYFNKIIEYSSSKIRFAFWAFFSKTGKTRVSLRVKMKNRWPGRERWPKWPIDPWPNDPVPCLSVTHNNTEYVVSRRVFESPNAFGGRAPPGPVERAWALPQAP